MKTLRQITHASQLESGAFELQLDFSTPDPRFADFAVSRHPPSVRQRTFCGGPLLDDDMGGELYDITEFPNDMEFAFFGCDE
ncbi:MAG: hypothetical protein RKO66_00865 [Candidatus Contendobacter sp.]|nr:hypothetical protein [Candidatus Contendobacter sp.]